MIIDAKDLVLGRIGSLAARKALLGEKVEIVNCEEAVITGDKEKILEKYLHRMHRGQPRTGPFFYKQEDRFVKRTIRGMLPHKQPRGRDAFKRIRCYIGLPEELKNQKIITLPEANVSKMQNLKYLRVKDVCKFVGKKE